MNPAEAFEQTCQHVRARPRKWLVTGAAGFIGSNLVEQLLTLGQTVMGLDNFSTGFRKNLDQVLQGLGDEARKRFTFVEGDTRNLDTCMEVCRDQHVVLHQAALGSVPRSIKSPLDSHGSNVNGFLNMLMAVKDRGIPRFVYASSSSVYGDHPGLPKKEDITGKPLSPYSLTKSVGEQYAEIFGATYGISHIGLRYFNVFGARQTTEGPYAAVIPRWFKALWQGETPSIFGDGETSRDFCYVKNVLQMNLLAGTVSREEAQNRVYNVAVGNRTTLNRLFTLIRQEASRFKPQVLDLKPAYQDFRPGDVPHSLADISRARELLGYVPTHTLEEGLEEAAAWYAAHLV